MALTNRLWKMHTSLTIMHNPITDQLGGKPRVGMEVLLKNIPAEVQVPTISDVVLATEQVEQITHRMRIRYEPRIKTGMIVIWSDDEGSHNAKVRQNINENYAYTYSILVCEEYAWSDE